MRAQFNRLDCQKRQATRMTDNKAAWIKGVVADNKHLTSNHFSLRIDAAIAPFLAGQYTSLGLPCSEGDQLAEVAQPYSILSAPGAQPIEFFCHTTPDGSLSSDLQKLQKGDNVWIQQQPEGSFTLKQVPSAKQLWMIATGTGVAPFLSMLCTPEPWQRFEYVILVYAMRKWQDLGYGELIEQLRREHPQQFHFIPFVSREKVANTIHGHIPACITNGTLERVAGQAMSPQGSQFMLCGNPGMVQDATVALEQKGYSRHSVQARGQITLESYW
jgi:ferredoxin--NADP+ reductase